jgi:hypothetical protein
VTGAGVWDTIHPATKAIITDRHNKVGLNRRFMLASLTLKLESGDIGQGKSASIILNEDMGQFSGIGSLNKVTKYLLRKS